MVPQEPACTCECGPKVRSWNGTQSLTFETSEVTTMSGVSRSESVAIASPICQGRVPT